MFRRLTGFTPSSCPTPGTAPAGRTTCLLALLAVAAGAGNLAAQAEKSAAPAGPAPLKEGNATGAMPLSAEEQ